MQQPAPHLLLSGIQVFPAERFHAVLEAAFHQGVVHAQAAERVGRGEVEGHCSGFPAMPRPCAQALECAPDTSVGWEYFLLSAAHIGMLVHQARCSNRRRAFPQGGQTGSEQRGGGRRRSAALLVVADAGRAWDISVALGPDLSSPIAHLHLFNLLQELLLLLRRHGRHGCCVWIHAAAAALRVMRR